MDTSGKNIEMCGKSIEIQKEWKCEIGDHYYDQFSQEVKISVRDVSQSIIFQYFTWLPRQDQLQDMISIDRTNLNKNYPDFVYLFDYFYIWWDDDYKYTQTFKSAEQTWLAYVMEEKYGKRWDGTNWVVE